jgi:glycosyltransferase involved in cell wall biosynthesis
MGGSNLHLLPDIIRFMRTLSRIGADIYLIKLPRHMLLPLSLYARFAGKRVIFIGQVDADANASKLKPTDRSVASWMYRMGLWFTSAIVAQTETQKSGFERVFQRDVRVIRNIVTMAQEQPVEKEGYILWVGNSGRHKQPELFLELARALPHLRFRMIMSLSGQRPSDDFIRAKLGDLPNVEFLGFVPFAEMASHYKGAALLVSTSNSEGFPNVFLQSWQFGTPTVSLNIDPDGVIEHYELGRLSKTFDKLVEDVKLLLEKPELRERLGRNAMRYTAENHAQDVVIDQYIDLFNDLLEK